MARFGMIVVLGLFIGNGAQGVEINTGFNVFVVSTFGALQAFVTVSITKPGATVPILKRTIALSSDALVVFGKNTFLLTKKGAAEAMRIALKYERGLIKLLPNVIKGCVVAVAVTELFKVSAAAGEFLPRVIIPSVVQNLESDKDAWKKMATALVNEALPALSTSEAKYCTTCFLATSNSVGPFTDLKQICSAPEGIGSECRDLATLLVARLKYCAQQPGWSSFFSSAPGGVGDAFSITTSNVYANLNGTGQVCKNW